MKVFYSIHVRIDRPNDISIGDKIIATIFEDFEDACDALEMEIRNYDKDFVPPDREPFRKLFNKSAVYYKWDKYFFGFLERPLMEKRPRKEKKASHEPEKSKDYVYQYYVEKDYKDTTTLSLTQSKKYSSFDEACDAMDKELTERYEAIGKPGWQARMTREEYKDYMGDSSAISYDFFSDGTPISQKYVLCRREA